MRDVADSTDFKIFWHILNSFFLVTIDSILWSLTNTLIVSLFFVVGLLAYSLSKLVHGLFGLTNGIGRKNENVTRVDSEVHDKYAEKLGKIINGKIYWRTIVEKLANKSSEFDFDLAEFHLQLAALVYEPKEKDLDKVLNSWPSELEIEHNRFGNDGCCILAVWSVKHAFVDLVFKGTSPFDLSEWLTDFSMQKHSARNGILPGLIHAGFYNVFGFPNTEIVNKGDANTDMIESLGVNNAENENAFESLGNGSAGRHPLPQDDLWKKDLHPNFRDIADKFSSDTGKKPNLWIAGHSLGAATATIFTSMLLWRRTSIGGRSGIDNLDWDEKFTLCGTYTYGNPRVGDEDWLNAITSVLEDDPKYQFYRVINANDIVCTVPLAMSGRYFKEMDSQGVFTLSDFHHLGTPVHLPYRYGKLQYTERKPWNVAKNLIVEIVSTPCQLLEGSLQTRTLVLLNLCTYGMLGFIRDHTTAEYLRNLEAMRQTQ